MTMKCDYCELIEENRGLIYQDDTIVIAVKDIAVVPGQVTVFPKKHYTIIEQIPDAIVVQCALMANKVGVAVFEALGCQGTNVIIKNGLSAGQTVPHCALEIIPRAENDNLPLRWEPQPVPEDELEVTASLLREELANLPPDSAKEKELTKNKEKPIPEKPADNYLLKSIRRMP